MLHTPHVHGLRPNRLKGILILGIVLGLLAGVSIHPRAQSLEPRFSVEKLNGLDFSPDGKHLAVGLPDEIQIRNAETGLLEQTLEDGVPAATWGNGALDWNPSSAVLAVLQRSTIDLWDTAKGQLLKKLDRPARVLAWSGDGQSLYIGGKDHNLSALDITTWQERQILSLPGALMALAASPDDKALAIAIQDDPDSPKIIDARTGEVQRKLALPPEQHPATMLLWSPDGAFILGSMDEGNVQGYTAIWEAATGKYLPTDRILPAGALSWQPDGKQFAAVTYLVDMETDQATAALFDLKGTSLRDLVPQAKRPRFVVWAGDLLAVADESGSVYVIAP